MSAPRLAAAVVVVLAVGTATAAAGTAPPLERFPAYQAAPPPQPGPPSLQGLPFTLVLPTSGKLVIPCAAKSGAGSFCRIQISMGPSGKRTTAEQVAVLPTSGRMKITVTLIPDQRKFVRRAGRAGVQARVYATLVDADQRPVGLTVSQPVKIRARRRARS